MKRRELLRHLEANGCFCARDTGPHSNLEKTRARLKFNRSRGIRKSIHICAGASVENSPFQIRRPNRTVIEREVVSRAY
jgi:hypothetical protein